MNVIARSSTTKQSITRWIASLALAMTLLSGTVYAAPLLPGQDTKQPVQIDADKLEVSQTDKTAIFSGNVVAQQGSMTLKAQRMVVHYLQGSASKNAISKIEVSGGVSLTTPNESAKGGQGYFDVQNEFVQLTGDVVLTRGQNIIKGSELKYDIKKGQSSIGKNESTGTGRVRGLFVPGGK